MELLPNNRPVKLLELGLAENEILKRLDKSPTFFTLDAAQVQELKRLGATEGLLSAMQPGRTHAVPDGPKVSDFAIVLDCSGSMAELTRDGQIKMDVAKLVVAPGDYDLWIEPADGGRSERVAERLKVEAGKATLVE